MVSRCHESCWLATRWKPGILDQQLPTVLSNIWPLLHHTTAGEAEHLLPDQLGVVGTAYTTIQINNTRVEFLNLLKSQKLEPRVSCQTYLTYCQALPMKETWNTSISEVCVKSHALRNIEPISDRDLCCAMRRWMHFAIVAILTRKSFSRDSGGNSPKSGRKGALQLTSRSSSSKGDWRDIWMLPACGEAGNTVSSSLCHKISSLKIFPLLQLMNSQKHPAVKTDKTLQANL